MVGGLHSGSAHRSHRGGHRFKSVPPTVPCIRTLAAVERTLRGHPKALSDKTDWPSAEKHQGSSPLSSTT